MALGWIIFGTFGELTLALLFFMLAAFAGGGMANGQTLSRLAIRLLDGALLLLPASCLASAFVAIYGYLRNWGPQTYYVYLVPLAFLAAYLLLMQLIIRAASKPGHK